LYERFIVLLFSFEIANRDLGSLRTISERAFDRTAIHRLETNSFEAATALGTDPSLRGLRGRGWTFVLLAVVRTTDSDKHVV